MSTYTEKLDELTQWAIANPGTAGARTIAKVIEDLEGNGPVGDTLHSVDDTLFTKLIDLLIEFRQSGRREAFNSIHAKARSQVAGILCPVKKPAPAPDYGERYQAKYVTHGESPGYRDITLHVEIDGDGFAARPLQLHFGARDALKIVCDIQDINRFAWGAGRTPLDAKEGESRPTWV